MKRAELLREGVAKLKQAGFIEASLEAEVLLRFALRINRVELYLSLDAKVCDCEAAGYYNLLSRRLEYEPLAYIVQNREFYGLDFTVDPRVLIPRPETEMLVSEALKIASGISCPVVSDIGTGSGAIIVSIAKHITQGKLYGVDRSPDAVDVAISNADKHNVRDKITFLTGDLLTALPENSNIIIANLPYVKSSEVKNVRGEPVSALDGGEDGLDVIRRLIKQLPEKLLSGGTCILEIGEGQYQAIKQYIAGILPEAITTVRQDFAGFERMVTITLPSS